MVEPWALLQRTLLKGGRALLVVVAESSGSSPGRAGFLMAVTPEESAGTIGGGQTELLALERARRVLEGDPPPSPLRFHLREEESGTLCGGEMTLLFLPVPPAFLEEVERIVGALRQGGSGTLAITPTTLSWSATLRREPLFERLPKGWSFLSPLGSRWRASLIGGGHLAVALAKILPGLGFSVALFDERHEENPFTTVGERVPQGEESYVVVMTSQHLWDEVALRSLLRRPFAYLALVASPEKGGTIKERLAKEGFSREELARIVSPAGVPIGSQTPEEIAVSIAAQMIRVRNLKAL